MTEQNPGPELFSALSQAQGELEPVHKTSEANTGSYTYRYADLAAVVETVSKVIATHGLAIAQFPTTSAEGKPTLTTYLTHASGQYLVHEMPLFLPKNDPQGQGSAITYARRYAYCAVLGVVADVDDDGVRAVTAQTDEQRAVAEEQDRAYQAAMAKATELRSIEGDDGRYMAELKSQANAAGFNLVGQWARAYPQDVFDAAAEYLEIVKELKMQEAQAQPDAPAPAKAARKRAPARAKPGSAVELPQLPEPDDDTARDAADDAIAKLRETFGGGEVTDGPDRD